MGKLLIATHDAGSGEKPKNLLSWLVIPFARTQSKNIAEQIEAGARMFDMRAVYCKDTKTYHYAHGLFTSKRTLDDIFNQINQVEDDVYVTMTYEHKPKNQEEIDAFISWVHTIKEKYSHIIWGQIALKYTDDDLIVDWKVIENADNRWPATVSKFLGLNGKRWQTYLPIPWLWKKIYYNKPEFNDTVYTYVDFL